MKEGQITWRDWWLAGVIGTFSALLYVLLLLTPVQTNAQSGASVIPCNLPSTFNSNWFNNVKANYDGWNTTSKPDLSQPNNRIALFKTSQDQTINNYIIPNTWYFIAYSSATGVSMQAVNGNTVNITTPGTMTSKIVLKMNDDGTVHSRDAVNTTNGYTFRTSNICGLTNETIQTTQVTTYAWQKGFPPAQNSELFWHPMTQHAEVQMCPTNSKLTADHEACATQQTGGGSGGSGMDETTFRTVVGDYAVKAFALILTFGISYLIVKQFRYRG